MNFGTSRRRNIFAFLAFGLAIPALASALDTVFVFPTFDAHLVLTTEPVTVVFDASLAHETVGDSSVFVTPWGESAHVPGALSVQSTTIADDTVVFTPADPWVWGARYTLHLTSDLEDTTGSPFAGSLADDGLFVANIPNDFVVPEYDPAAPLDMIMPSIAMMGFDPLDPEADADPWRIPGFNATGAWKYSTGSPGILVAVVDAGFYTYDDAELRRAYYLNAGELPLPNVSGAPCAEYDCNDDGRFDVDDDQAPGDDDDDDDDKGCGC